MKAVYIFLMIFIFQKFNSQTTLNSLEISNDDTPNVYDNRNFAAETMKYSSLSYVTGPFMDLGSPKGYYILSADVSPQFVVGGDWIRIPIHFTPRYKVRIFHENLEEGDVSLPVRTPSFMPGVSVYFKFKDLIYKDAKINYFSISLFHHSNGQDGEEFLPDGRVNLYNGNFSTNFIEPAYHFRNRKIFNDLEHDDFYGKISIEKHFITAEKLVSSYGDYRLNIGLGFLRVRRKTGLLLNNDRIVKKDYSREKDRLIFNSTFILGNRNRGLGKIGKRINFDFNYNKKIPGSPNTAIFIGLGYYGSDPYNIYYEQNYFFVKAGLSFGFFLKPNFD